MKSRTLLGIVALLALVFAVARSSSFSSTSTQVKDGHVFELPEQEMLKDVVKLEPQDDATADFPKSLGLKLTNLTDKPIYGLHVTVIYRGTGALSSNGYPLGSSMTFGRTELVDYSAPAKAGEDPSIKPGESVLLRFNELQAANDNKVLTQMFSSSAKGLKSLQTVFMSITTINFGDGTGYNAGYPSPGVK
jgi:hypothetical protein